MSQKTQNVDSRKGSVLYMAMELSRRTWKLGFSSGGRRHRIVNVESGDLLALASAVDDARTKFGLPVEAQVKSCYEAGRDGFWIHRALEEAGAENVVIDPASVQVNRRARRAKTDRIDVKKLLRELVKHHDEDEERWSVVRVPSVEDEDERRLHRELSRLKKERIAHRNRMLGLLVTQGLRLKPGPKFLENLDAVRIWNGEPVPPALKSELEREYARLALVQGQIRELVARQKARLEAPDIESDEKAAHLSKLKGIGPHGGWVLSKELFGWRVFNNRKEVGALVGLTPTPYDSGDSEREQGISKAGNRSVRALMVQLAWCWLRFQPESKLSRWYFERYGGGGSRSRRIGIIAVARKLLVALWKYVERGEIPDGALLKA